MSTPNGARNLGRDELSKVNLLDRVVRPYVDLPDGVPPEGPPIFRGQGVVDRPEVLAEELLDGRIVWILLGDHQLQIGFLLLQGVVLPAIVVPGDPALLEQDVQPLHLLLDLLLRPGRPGFFLLLSSDVFHADLVRCKFPLQVFQQIAFHQVLTEPVPVRADPVDHGVVAPVIAIVPLLPGLPVDD